MLTILPGAGGIKDIYKQALESEKIDVICLSKNYEDVIGDYFENEVCPKLKKKQVREIIPKTDNNRIYRQKNQSNSYKIRLLNSSDVSETDMMIVDQAVYFISFNREHPYGIISCDPEMVKQMKIQFEQLWDSCSE